MNNRDFVSRVSNQLRMINKDEYISDRFILRTGESIARKFITQKIQRRSIDRDSSLYRPVNCIEFEPVDKFTCKYVEFRSCEQLSKSVKKFSDLIYTRYGSSIKELYSIDGKFSFNESTLYQNRIDKERGGNDVPSRFYVLGDYIYVPERVDMLSALVLMPDQYELDAISSCEEGEANCESAWEKIFICPDSLLSDVIDYTIQNVSVTKQITPDERSNLNENEK